MADTTSEFLLPTGSAANKYQVHPLVLFNIFDQFSRRENHEFEVAGTLLGYVNEGVLHITNSFGVPLSKKTQSINKKYEESMRELQLKAGSRELVVGWYSTGTELNSKFTSLYKYYTTITASPIHLLVSTDLRKGLSVKGYTVKPMTVSSKVLGAQFQQVKMNVTANEPEQIAVDLLLKEQKEEHKTNALKEMGSSIKSLEKMNQLINAAKRYVDQVVDGDEKGDEDMGIHLFETLRSAHDMDLEEFNSSFNTALQDNMMASYLANVTRHQLAFTDAIQRTLN
eukprot:gb/GECH01012559.1/.p1 GENE.gb/GECH01012559.1/~~gb/GECH01012559.1/.p1  ORF type:complete len:283 (+),score=67.40 gb/GECH01012559.1/:1-849(+)